jgi:hypothetical protein
VGFFRRRRGQDLGTADGNPSAVDDVDDLPSMVRYEADRHGGRGVIEDMGEAATQQDLGRDMESDGDALDASEDRLYDALGPADSESSDTQGE